MRHPAPWTVYSIPPAAVPTEGVRGVTGPRPADPGCPRWATGSPRLSRNAAVKPRTASTGEVYRAMP